MLESSLADASEGTGIRTETDESRQYSHRRSEATFDAGSEPLQELISHQILLFGQDAERIAFYPQSLEAIKPRIGWQSGDGGIKRVGLNRGAAVQLRLCGL